MNFVKVYWRHALFIVLFITYTVVGYQQVHGRGVSDGADRVFRWCYDEGGILKNHETEERIGCAAIVARKQQPLDKEEKSWYNNS